MTSTGNLFESANSLCVLAVHVMGNAATTYSTCYVNKTCHGTGMKNSDLWVRAGSGASTMARASGTDINVSRRSADGSLERQYEHPRRGRLTGRETLVVVARHAAKHMGQAELTLDLLLAAKGRPPVARDAFGTPIRK